MAYKSILNPALCSGCAMRPYCFLIQLPLQEYPEETQRFILFPPTNTFQYCNIDHRWHANYRLVENQIIAYYDASGCYLLSNRKPLLSIEAQKEDDRKSIREELKRLLDVAAKVTEDTDPIASIVFDGIGVILASDYLEVIFKILSMFSKHDKIVRTDVSACPRYSVSS